MDPFTLLGLPRRPWLDASAIRAAFQNRARQCHPDAEGGDAGSFAALNAAHATLADPGMRLRLLAGDAPLPATPSGVALGFRIADFLRRAAAASERVSPTANVLTRALAMKEAAALRSEGEEIASALEVNGANLESRLRDLDARWPAVDPQETAALSAEHLFLKRWREQLREARVSLEIASRPDAIPAPCSTSRSA